MIVGTCAYCQRPVERGLTSKDMTPVVYGKGFYELRQQGGANAFTGGVERLDNRIWHKRCALRHRDEARNGRQETLL